MKWRVDFGPAYSLLKVYLEPGEDVTSEAGAMVMYKGNIEVKTHTGGGLLKGILRAVAGTESLFLNTYRAVSPSEIWFAPRVPGDISYIDLASGSWIIQDSGYLAHHGNVDISVAWRGLRGLLAEGQLLWLKVSGRGGVWINSYGALDRIVLNPGERAVVDNFHFVAMPANVRWEARTFGGLKSFIFGGEGIIFEVWGPAIIYVQTRTLPLLADSLRRYIGAR